MGTENVTHAESMQGFMEASRRVCTTRRHGTADSANFCHRSNSTATLLFLNDLLCLFYKMIPASKNGALVPDSVFGRLGVI